MNNLTFLRKCQAFLSVFWLKMLDLRDMCCVINIIYSHDSLAFTVQMSICMVFLIAIKGWQKLVKGNLEVLDT